MPNFTVRYRRPDGSADARRVQAESASAARAAVEARGRSVIAVEDEHDGVALEDPAPAAQPSGAAALPFEAAALLRSIDHRLEALGKASLLRDPARPIIYAILMALAVWTVVLPAALYAVWLMIQISSARSA